MQTFPYKYHNSLPILFPKSQIYSPMANPILRSINPNKALLHVFGLVTLLLLIQRGGAYEFTVGGSTGWAPTDSNAFNQWAESKRFQIGDALVFNYAADQDAVLYVTKDDYENCNTANPIAKYADGHTVYKFNQSGPHYFISGVKEHCLKNEKLVVIVLADRSNKNGSAPPPADQSIPSPPPDQSIPSPPPDQSIPSPPPSNTTPTPSPEADGSSKRHKNAASSTIISFICSIGAFVGSSLLLVF